MRTLLITALVTMMSTMVIAEGSNNGSLNTNSNNGTQISANGCGQDCTIDATISNVITHDGGYNDTQTVNQNVSNETTQRVISNQHATVSNLTTSGHDTCFGSQTTGLSVAGVSASTGGTVIDENCVRIKNVKLFQALGLNDAAIALMLQDPANAAAFAIAYPELAAKFGVWVNPDQ